MAARRRKSFPNQAWFLRRYATVIGPKLKAAVLAQDPEQVFENWQGLMVGEGSRNIWVRIVGPDLEPKYEIITIDGGPRNSRTRPHYYECRIAGAARQRVALL